MEQKKTEQTKFFMYKNRPLVRCGDDLYYGSMANNHVVKITVKSKKEEDGMTIADSLVVQLLAHRETDITKIQKKVVTRDTLYSAIDIANIWLNRQEREEKKAEETKEENS